MVPVAQCYPQPVFDTESVLFDLNYFKYCFLKPTDLDFHELKLEANFRLFAKDLTAESCDAFLYRDFQARNVMLVNMNDDTTRKVTSNRILSTSKVAGEVLSITTWPRSSGRHRQDTRINCDGN